MCYFSMHKLFYDTGGQSSEQAKTERVKADRRKRDLSGPRPAMMMIAFITFKSSLVPLFEGL